MKVAVLQLSACIDDYRSSPREIVFVIVSPLLESSDTSLSAKLRRQFVKEE